MVHEKVRRAKERLKQRRRRKELEQTRRESRVRRERERPGSVEDLSRREHIAVARAEIGELADELGVSPSEALSALRGGGSAGAGVLADIKKGASKAAEFAESMDDQESGGINQPRGGSRGRRRTEEPPAEPNMELLDDEGGVSVDEEIFGDLDGDGDGGEDLDDVFKGL